jgi:single-strand DNA-binding protein
MASMNQVLLVGNLTRDPEIRRTAGEGKAVCTFTLAVDNGSKKEGAPTAEFIPVTVWEKSAEACAEHLMKGSSVLVAGRLKVEKWEAEGKKRSRLAVVARTVQFLGRTKEKRGAATGASPAPVPGGAEEYAGDQEDLDEEEAITAPEEA